MRSRNIGFVILSGLLIIALSVGTCALVSRATDGFSKGVDTLLKNEDNLVHQIEEYEFKEGSLGNGLTITSTSLGKVKIEGSLKKEASPYEIALGTVTVEEDGYYPLAGAEGGSLDTYYLKATYKNISGATVTIEGDFVDNRTTPTEIAAGTEITLSIVVYSGTDLKVTVAPTLVLGEKIGKY